MTIVDRYAITQYGNVRLTIQIANDEILTVDSIELHADIDVFNADGRHIDTDHPAPQATTAQLEAFLAWINSNLALYESVTGLTQKVDEEAGE